MEEYIKGVGGGLPACMIREDSVIMVRVTDFKFGRSNVYFRQMKKWCST